METVEWRPRKLRFQQGEKNPRGCVLVAVIQVGSITSRCSGNEPLRKSLQWVPYAQIANDPFAKVTFI